MLQFQLFLRTQLSHFSYLLSLKSDKSSGPTVAVANDSQSCAQLCEGVLHTNYWKAFEEDDCQFSLFKTLTNCASGVGGKNKETLVAEGGRNLDNKQFMRDSVRHKLRSLKDRRYSCTCAGVVILVIYCSLQSAKCSLCSL